MVAQTEHIYLQPLLLSQVFLPGEVSQNLETTKVNAWEPWAEAEGSTGTGVPLTHFVGPCNEDRMVPPKILMPDK